MKFEEYKNRGSYNKEQLRVISRAIKHGLDMELFGDPDIRASDMEEYYKLLKDGCDVSEYLEQGFDYRQSIEILFGKRQRLPVKLYAVAEYNAAQMRVLRQVLSDERRDSKYGDELPDEQLKLVFDPRFSAEQLEVIYIELKSRQDFERDADFSICLKPEYSAVRIELLCESLIYGFDLSIYDGLSDEDAYALFCSRRDDYHNEEFNHAAFFSEAVPDKLLDKKQRAAISSALTEAEELDKHIDFSPFIRSDYSAERIKCLCRIAIYGGDTCGFEELDDAALNERLKCCYGRFLMG